MNNEKELTSFGTFFAFICFVVSIGLIGLTCYFLYRHYPFVLEKYYFLVFLVLFYFVFGFLESISNLFDIIIVIFKLLFACNFIFFIVVSFDNNFTRNWIYKKQQ